MRNYREGLVEVHAIVPVKTLTLAKTRLAPVLDPTERARFSVAMLVDVLEALRKVKKLHSVTVVSADRSVRKIAWLHGATLLWEGKSRGLNTAVRLAIRDSKFKGASAALIMPADIPLVTSREILNFLDHAAGYAVALNPSKDGTGTNALLMHPPGIIRPVFGRNSFQKHLALANRQGLPPSNKGGRYQL